MEHRFTGPRYTLGIEEELMIVDSSSFGLVSGINSILGADPRLEARENQRFRELIVEQHGRTFSNVS